MYKVWYNRSSILVSFSHQPIYTTNFDTLLGRDAFKTHQKKFRTRKVADRCVLSGDKLFGLDALTLQEDYPLIGNSGSIRNGHRYYLGQKLAIPISRQTSPLTVDIGGNGYHQGFIYFVR